MYTVFNLVLKISDMQQNTIHYTTNNLMPSCHMWKKNILPFTFSFRSNCFLNMCVLAFFWSQPQVVIRRTAVSGTWTFSLEFASWCKHPYCHTHGQVVLCV